MDQNPLSFGGGEVLRGLPAGLPVLFQFPLQRNSYRSAYVGTIPGHAVILRLPLIPGMTRLLSEAYAVIVRFVHDGQAYGFEARFMAAIRQPLPLLFVTFPERIHQVNLRGCDRVAVLEKAVLKVGEESLEGMMLDVSCGGCKIRLPRTEKALSLAQGDEAVVEFGLSLGERVPCALKGTLLHVDSQGNRVKCRLSFVKDQEQELSQLADLLRETLKMLRD